MAHKYFIKKSKQYYILQILNILEFNEEICSITELNGYTKKELKQILPRLKYNYNNIHSRNNEM